MRKIMILLLLLACIVSGYNNAKAETVQSEGEMQIHSFSTFVSEAGDVYDWFTLKKLYFEADHRVTHVSGYYERFVAGEECDSSEKALGSDRTYKLAEDFHADMLNSMSGGEIELIPVTDLYTWYIDAYHEGMPIDHDWIFTADLSDEELETTDPDFWFVTTQIELNDQGEIQYMQYVFVPWG